MSQPVLDCVITPGPVDTLDAQSSEQPELASLLSLPAAQARAAITLAHGGTVTAAAAAAGVHRSTIYHWYDKDVRFWAAVNDVQKERNLRLLDEMRHLESLALSRLRRILEDDTVSPSVHLRAATLILNRPKDATWRTEKWSLPKMENLDQQLEKTPGLAEPPKFDIHRHFSTELPAPAPAPLDTPRHNSTEIAGSAPANRPQPVSREIKAEPRAGEHIPHLRRPAAAKPAPIRVHPHSSAANSSLSSMVGQGMKLVGAAGLEPATLSLEG